MLKIDDPNLWLELVVAKIFQIFQESKVFLFFLADKKTVDEGLDIMFTYLSMNGDQLKKATLKFSLRKVQVFLEGHKISL